MKKPLHFFGSLPQQIQIKGDQAFDYSRMVGHYFKPEEKICLIFDNVNYDKLRRVSEFQNRHDEESGSLDSKLQYDDMPNARIWADRFEDGIKDFGFSYK